MHAVRRQQQKQKRQAMGKPVFFAFYVYDETACAVWGGFSL
jgi:hypothetical protein